MLVAVALAALAQPGSYHIAGADAGDPRRMRPPITLSQIRTMNGNPTRTASDPAALPIGADASRRQDERRSGQVRSVRHEMSSMFRHSDYARRITDLEDSLISLELRPHPNDPEQVRGASLGGG